MKIASHPQPSVYSKAQSLVRAQTQPPTIVTLSPAVGLSLGAQQIHRYQQRIIMRVLGGISSPAQTHTGLGLC